MYEHSTTVSSAALHPSPEAVPRPKSPREADAPAPHAPPVLTRGSAWSRAASPVVPPQTCPTCGRAYDLFDHDTSRLLEWVERLHQDLHHLKAAIEEDLP